MSYFNFTRLVEKYSREITVIIPATKELKDSGDWVRVEPKEVTIEGAVIRHRENKVYRSEGTLSLNDYALFLLEEPNFKLIGTKVICDSKEFRVESTLNNAEFTGVWSFNLKYVSAFKEGDDK